MGPVRDLKRESKKPEDDSDKVKLFSRLRELRLEEGKNWADIAQIVEEEGFRERGKVITDTALRKRFTRWSEAETPASFPEPSNPVSVLSEPVTPGVPIPGLEELLAINNRLLSQIQESNSLMQMLEKRLEEQKTSHTNNDVEPPVNSRDLLQLLKEITSRRDQMMHIEEERKDYAEREEVRQLIDEVVEERVESELKAMLSEGGSFSRELTDLIDQRLKTLFSCGEPVATTPRAGPGRGRKGKSHTKFSASLESNLFVRVKSLPGQFSRHLANALSTYLSVMEEKKGD